MDTPVIAMLYRMVNECDATRVPMGSLYNQLSEMIRLEADTPEQVEAILAQIDGKRR